MSNYPQIDLRLETSHNFKLTHYPAFRQLVRLGEVTPTISNPANWRDLPASWTTLEQLSRLEPADFKWAQERGLITKLMSGDGARWCA